MELRNILIADGSDDFLLAMTLALQRQFHVLCCQNGSQALELLRNETIHLLILDLALPELDGITLLETIYAENIRPLVLATTRLLNDYVYQSVQRLDVGYLVCKPLPAAAIAARAEDLLGQAAPARKSQKDQQFLEETLAALGVKSKHDGWDYLMAIIPSHQNDPNQSFTKVLYPDTGKQFGCSGSSVDRAIRYALQKAWETGDPGLWQQFFPGYAKCPSNSEFIIRISEELRKNRE